MAVSNYVDEDVQSFTTATDFSGNYGRQVVITTPTNGIATVVLATSGAVADGVVVSAEYGAPNYTVGVMTTHGKKVQMVVASGITGGGLISSDASGKGTNATTGQAINGKAVNTVGDDNNLVTAIFGYKGVQA